MKHTEGPWEYSFEGSITAFITAPNGRSVVKLTSTANTDANARLSANTRLIAAAPSLLAALEAIKLCGSKAAMVKIADEAIKKVHDAKDL